jgi:hypothetical protein
VAALTVYFQLLELRPKVEICNLTAALASVPPQPSRRRTAAGSG